MHTKSHVRAVIPEDYETLARIAGELNVMHAQALPDRFRVAADPLPTDYEHSLLDGDDAAILVAERDGELVGYAILQIRESSAIPIAVPRRYAFLSDLAVTQAERGQGIGRQLMEVVVAWAKEQGATALELGVFEFNQSAIAFYEHLGFTTVKRTMALPLHGA